MVNLPTETRGVEGLNVAALRWPMTPDKPAQLDEGNSTMRTLVIATVATVALVPVSPATASSNRIDPRIVTFGETRQQIQNTPVLERPYRPLHVYGNTVRRRHSRGVSKTGN
jgi:hypothetical protein